MAYREIIPLQAAVEASDTYGDTTLTTTRRFLDMYVRVVHSNKHGGVVMICYLDDISLDKGSSGNRYSVSSNLKGSLGMFKYSPGLRSLRFVELHAPILTRSHFIVCCQKDLGVFEILAYTSLVRDIENSLNLRLTNSPLGLHWPQLWMGYQRFPLGWSLRISRSLHPFRKPIIAIFGAMAGSLLTGK
jgi:hypothetical protein